jgi:hypothetical protein
MNKKDRIGPWIFLCMYYFWMGVMKEYHGGIPHSESNNMELLLFTAAHETAPPMRKYDSIGPWIFLWMYYFWMSVMKEYHGGIPHCKC